MKTAISIPDKVFDAAETLGKRLGLSRSQLYTTAVAEFISKHRADRVTERLNEIYAHEDSSLPPSLINFQADSLAPEEW